MPIRSLRFNSNYFTSSAEYVSMQETKARRRIDLSNFFLISKCAFPFEIVYIQLHIAEFRDLPGRENLSPTPLVAFGLLRVARLLLNRYRLKSLDIRASSSQALTL